jgi:5-methylcytosine-specific restriction endonuclease McrA
MTASSAKPEKPFNGGQWTAARMRSFIMSALRRAQWPQKYASISSAYVRDGINPATGKPCKLHRCPLCKKLHPKGMMESDHIIPVIPITGFDSWDAVIKRLYCEVDGFTPTCRNCHREKTKKENHLRKEHRKAKRNNTSESTNPA